jgi:hypothetical protein
MKLKSVTSSIIYQAEGRASIASGKYINSSLYFSTKKRMIDINMKLLNLIERTKIYVQEDLYR